MEVYIVMCTNFVEDIDFYRAEGGYPIKAYLDRRLAEREAEKLELSVLKSSNLLNYASDFDELFDDPASVKRILIEAGWKENRKIVLNELNITAAEIMKICEQLNTAFYYVEGVEITEIETIEEETDIYYD